MAGAMLTCTRCGTEGVLEWFANHYCPPLDDTQRHAFDAYDGATGETCTHMVIEDGDGVECGLGPGHPIHDAPTCPHVTIPRSCFTCGTGRFARDLFPEVGDQ